MLADTDPTERAREVHRRSRAVLGPSSLAVGCGYYRSAAFALFAWMSGLLKRFKWHSVEQTASPVNTTPSSSRTSSFRNKTAPHESVRHRVHHGRGGDDKRGCTPTTSCGSSTRPRPSRRRSRRRVISALTRVGNRVLALSVPGAAQGEFYRGLHQTRGDAEDARHSGGDADG